MNNKTAKAVALILMLDLAVLFGWWWFYYEIKGKDAQIASIGRDIAAQEDKQKRIKELDQVLQSIASEKSKVDGAFAEGSNVVKFIEGLEMMASFSGAGLEIVSASLPAKVEEGGPFFTLNLSGSFGRLFKFLALLEKTSYQIKIESARFGVSEKGAWSSQIKLRLLSYKF
ncbi:MAG: hypothetical protein AAB527_03800 [Patescibacteria group bacterium]